MPTTLVGAVEGIEEPKSIKPLTLPPFSGADPVPKDDASCEQWVWQVKEALKSSWSSKDSYSTASEG